MSDPKTLSGFELQMMLADAGFESQNWSIADRRYAMATRGFIMGLFSKALWSFQAFFKVLNWTEDANDCDDFARLSAAFAQILHFLTPGRPPATALAVAEFWFVQDDGSGHAINLAICGNEVLAYEPQSRNEIELSADEKRRGTHVRF